MTPIIMLHGLGPAWINSRGLSLCSTYLQYSKGFENVHRVVYPADTTEFDDMLEAASAAIEKVVGDKKIPIVVIGASMGGVIANNLHKKGWTVLHGIYVGSPLHGARLLNFLDGILPSSVRNVKYKPAYGYLMTKEQEPEPPHPYHTFSMALPFTDFDLCVHKDEAILNPENHTHLPWSTHQFIWLNPRLWYHIGNELQSKM